MSTRCAVRRNSRTVSLTVRGPFSVRLDQPGVSGTTTAERLRIVLDADDAMAPERLEVTLVHGASYQPTWIEWDGRVPTLTGQGRRITVLDETVAQTLADLALGPRH